MLSFPTDGNLSLYLHIPFCTTCCSYCAFYSEPVDATKAYLQPYVDRLEKEIRACKAHLDRFFTIFIGGGNPGSLTADQLRRLLVAAKAVGSDEVNIGINPENFGKNYFSLFAGGLGTRLRIGIQSIDCPFY